MKITIPLITFILIFSSYTNALSQEHLIEWQRSLGGSSSDELISTKQTHDSGFVLLGSSRSINGDITFNHGGYDFWVVKISKTGLVEWQKSLGGSSDEYAGSIEITNDGGYIITGTTNSNDGDITYKNGLNDVWVVKLSSYGSIQWQKTYGGSNADTGNEIIQTVDGGFLIGSSSRSSDGDLSINYGDLDLWIFKIDAYGNIQWQKTYGSTSAEFLYSIDKTSDNGFIIAGEVSNLDILVLKLDWVGNLVWQKTLGGSGYDFHPTIKQTSDGGYILSAGTESVDGNVSENHGVSDFWVVKLNSLGDILWQKTYGGSLRDYAFFIKETPDNDYIVCGSTDSRNGDLQNQGGGGGAGDFWLLKISQTGTIIWQKKLGGGGYDLAYSAGITFDNGYFVSGISYYSGGDVAEHHANGTPDYWIIKLTPDITINTGMITGSFCSGSQINVPFSTTGPFALNNQFILQISDNTGSFNNPVNIGIINSNSSGIISGNIPNTILSDTLYRFRVVSSSPSITGSDNGANIIIHGGNVSIGSDVTSYFGYLPNQFVSKTSSVVNATYPLSFHWSLDRPLLYDVITLNGDESMTGVNSETVTVSLLDTANLCIAVTDANGCVFTSCATIYASDVRCFPGNNNTSKISLCHKTNSTNNPCVSICVNESAVSSHLSHGDFVGNCTNDCVAPEYYSRTITIEDTAKELLQLTIWPNPTDNYFNLTAYGKKNTTLKINIYDVVGRLIKKIDLLNNHQARFGDDFAIGVYIIEVLQDNIKKSIKLIKHR